MSGFCHFGGPQTFEPAHKNPKEVNRNVVPHTFHISTPSPYFYCNVNYFPLRPRAQSKAIHVACVSPVLLLKCHKAPAQGTQCIDTVVPEQATSKPPLHRPSSACTGSFLGVGGKVVGGDGTGWRRAFWQVEQPGEGVELGCGC